MRSEAVEAERRSAFGRATSARVIAFERSRSGDRAAAAVTLLVAQRREIPLDLLLHRSRCKPEIAEARMLAMYLVHVMLGRTYSQVGQFFGRDRTTVAHACSRIEDLRDEPRFEAEVLALEEAIDAIGADGEGNVHAAG
jgi:chromosomal replication initiation ATPase DnaA